MCNVSGVDLHKNASASLLVSGLIKTCRHLFPSCSAVSAFLDISVFNWKCPGFLCVKIIHFIYTVLRCRCSRCFTDRGCFACPLDRRRKEIAKMKNGKCVWKWKEDYMEISAVVRGGEVFRNLRLKMITHLWDLTPPNVRLLCNSPKDSAESLHLGLVLNLDGITKNRIDFWIDHRCCSINSERAFCTLGTREFKQDTGRQDIGKEDENLDFDMQILTRKN